MKIKLYQVDAFTHTLFGGNPAAVCVLEEWLPEVTMQHIAAENNLAETAFVVPDGDGYKIRWFTPTLEVDLCGHATLASAHVLFNYYGHPSAVLRFHSPRSGVLTVENKGYALTLDFPVDEVQPVEVPAALVQAFGAAPQEAYRGKTDYLLLYSTQAEIAAMQPDLKAVASVGGRGVIVSAPGDEADFVSRFFAPQAGIDEDPVTGSAHTTLAPIWSLKLGKTVLSALQLSKRGGELRCEMAGDRVKISGKAVTYLIGEIEV
ncbi:PhzF family phenazine biosynthesis protein [Pontibacter sp. E15-1]|uniref:PhzF family phenazine biosynthesis protein n=1 Tax=Pontibacter sp. E15-1 TaxID=2919918 RepID=UPI001F4F3199|nr:PhzF family phenazine biosynthesis protein [Pontibacter sp. E15-1]MCJ8166787.1 PhzF family phenazine biosynthesis protein [Pontibacter sp. E15-1]